MRIWGAGKNSRALQADLLSKSWPAPWGACASDDAYPSPTDVRALVERGLALGWDPSVRGGTFLLTEQDDASDGKLPGFLVTDRLWNPEAQDPTARVIHAAAAFQGQGELTQP
ncbi:hypothetical protein [Microbispora sp. NPDC049125]|uniref:hypothetical protein n=1 Tax=Microbispora sp. NPDC049125 TaxID=3154929 RepID=UPI003466DD9E